MWNTHSRYEVCDAITENRLNNCQASDYHKYYYISRATECKTYMYFDRKMIWCWYKVQIISVFIIDRPDRIKSDQTRPDKICDMW